jgi:hypothetical protein
VNRRARGDLAAKMIGEALGLGVGDVTLDIPQSVVAAIAAALDDSGVDVLA